MTKRIAIVVGVVCLLGAVAATFLPASPGGASCGSWVAPEWDEDEVDALVDQARDIYDRAPTAELQAKAAALAANARSNQQLCADALGTRRTIALVLLGVAVLGPVAVMFVGGAGRRRPDDST